MRTFRTRVWSGALGGGLVLVSSAVPIGTAANAVTARSPDTLGQKASLAAVAPVSAAPLASPAGYKVVTTGPFDAPGGKQTQAVAACPVTELPVGGGALLSEVGNSGIPLYASLNSSYPQRNLWVVDVNTVSNLHASFNVYVICIKAPTSYSVVSSASTANPAGSVTGVSVSCPTNRVVVGGGAFSVSSDIAVNISSDFAVNSTTWRAAMANQSATSTNMAVYAICQKQPKGYSIQSTVQNVPSGAETPGSVACPASGRFPLSGGEFTGAILSLHLNSSFPSSFDWVTFLNNGDSNSWPFLVTVVCAGT